jgi:hypothetical protein
MILNFLFMLALAGIASAFCWSRARNLNRPWSFEQGILYSVSILVCTLGIGCLIMYAFSKEYSVDWSPDRTIRVVVHKIPYISLTPQQSSDGPGFAEVYTAQGHCLDQIYLEEIQMAQVTWFDDFVEVGSVSVWYK